jgi:tetratricopeptide (TPR) repeat protein
MRGIWTALALILSGLPTVASAEWFQATSTHFIVYAEGKPDALRDYISGLERFDSAMRVLYGKPSQSYSSSDLVTIFVVPISRVERLYGDGGGEIAGFYSAHASGSIAFASSRDEDREFTARAVLFHEYAHHFMFTAWGNAPFPTWLIEGFAEFNAPSRDMPDGSVEIGLPPNYRSFGIYNQDLPVRRLVQMENLSNLREALIQALYGRGWLLFHYLMLEPSRSGQLSRYLSAIAKGADSQTAAEQSFGDLSKLEDQLNHYSTNRPFAMKVPANRLTVGPVTVRPLTPGETAVMPALLRSKRGVNAKTAPAVAAMAEKLADPFPNDAGAQNELAEAELDAGHYEAADAAATRALAVDSASLHALIYRGLSAMAIASRDQVKDPARWSAVRGWFLKANKLDPENAQSLQLFYQSFVAERRTPTANAQSALLYAQTLAPYDGGLRLTAADVLLQQNKPADAKTMLEPLAFSPHGGSETAFAAKLIDTIDKQGTDAARALMKPHEDDPTHPKGKDGPAI